MALAETIFDVRRLPWDGIGTGVQVAPTSKDALKLAGLDWTVESKPIYNDKGIRIPGYIANTRDKDGSVLGIVTDRYKVVQNSEAFAFTDELLKSSTPVTYETAGSLHGGKTIWLLAKMEGQKILGDDVDPYICFTNTHDGSGSVKICMTPVRVWCSNTLNLALHTAKRSWSTKHIGDITYKMEEARQTLGMAQDYMKALDQEAQILANTKMDDSKLEELIDIMYPVNADSTERKIRNVDMLKTGLFKCYHMPDIAKFRGTTWGGINAVADLVDHFQPARLTDTYRENNWGKIMVGHPLLDLMYKQVSA